MSFGTRRRPSTTPKRPINWTTDTGASTSTHWLPRMRKTVLTHSLWVSTVFRIRGSQCVEVDAPVSVVQLIGLFGVVEGLLRVPKLIVGTGRLHPGQVV